MIDSPDCHYYERGPWNMPSRGKTASNQIGSRHGVKPGGTAIHRTLPDGYGAGQKVCSARYVSEIPARRTSSSHEHASALRLTLATGCPKKSRTHVSRRR